MLAAEKGRVAAVGIDPTRNLLAAQQQDPTGKYVEAEAASLPFDDASFSLVPATFR